MHDHLLDDAALLDWLATRDAPCPVCGYNLRGVAAPRCPECDAALGLDVRSPQAAVGPWAVGMLSLALALGFDSVSSTLLLGGYIINPPPAGARIVLDGILAALVGLALASAGGLVVLARWRRAFWRRRAAWQWRVAWMVFAATGVVHAAVGAWCFHRVGLF